MAETERPPAGSGSGDDIPAWLGFTSIAVLSGAIMLVEVSVTRVLAYRLFYHYVYMVISTALLGISAGATAVALRAASGRPLGRATLARSAFVFAGLVPLVLFATTRATPPPNVSAGKLEGVRFLLFLPLTYVLLTGLFLAGGLATAILFARFRARVSTLYFWDLLGAACGAVGAVALMKLGSPLRSFLAAGLIVSALGLLLEARRRALAAGLTLVLLGLTVGGPQLFDPARNIFSSAVESPIWWRWNHQARVDLYPGDLVIDSDASTRLAPLTEGPLGPRAPAIAPFYELPYDILGPERRPEVAIIGAGGGVDIYSALRRGAARVVAIEINQSIFRAMIADPRSVYRHVGVEAIEGEGRHALRFLRGRYDLIQLSLTDTYTASAHGAYALTENYLYTVEAFEEYLDHLKPGGHVFITRWLFDPPRETLRLCTMGHEALRRRGAAEPARHVAVVGGAVRWQDRFHGGFVLSRDPLDEQTIGRITASVARQGFQLKYLPGRPQDNAFNRFFAAPDPEAFYRSYPFQVDPVTDARPFFFQYFRLTRLPEAVTSPGSSVMYMSQVALVLTLGVALLLSAGIVLLPARRASALAAASLRPWVGLYFGALGLGFMLVEIPLIQRFTLYLGHPTHALVTILSSLLVSAAVGSLLAGRLPLGRRGSAVIAVVAAAVAAAIALVPSVSDATLGLPFSARVALCLALVAPLGVGLGLPLTVGIRSIAAHGEALTAWAWACNGAASVVASCLAMVTLVYLGFPWALALGAACYVAAAATLPRLRPPGTPRG